jgi:hypothetical protein
MKTFLIVLLVVVLGCAAFVTTRPATYHVERTATVSAAPGAVYAGIADFREWQAWSPWERLDPHMRKSFSGAASGVGAGYHWSSEELGEGRMTITEAAPGERVVIDLEFIEPWRARNVTAFALRPAAQGTVVTWTMDGRNDFLGKAMSLFVSMDRMIGADFEKGLAALDSLARGGALADTDTVAVPAGE